MKSAIFIQVGTAWTVGWAFALYVVFPYLQARFSKKAHEKRNGGVSKGLDNLSI